MTDPALLRQANTSLRITDKKIENFITFEGVTKTAEILGISQGRVSQLRGEKKLREWIVAAGKREKFLDAIEVVKAQKKEKHD